MIAPQEPTVCQEMVSSPVQQGTTVWVVVLMPSCLARLVLTALSLASAKWSSASSVQQVRVLSLGCLQLYMQDTIKTSIQCILMH